jgi:choline kinase
MECLIIAAGRGSRFGDIQSKPLLTVRGRPLIEWVISAAMGAGIRTFRVVTGYAAEKVESYLEGLARQKKIVISFIRNDEWEKENGLSVLKARDGAPETFVLLMSDHLLDAAILARLVTRPIAADETILAVDFNIAKNPSVDLEDVTKVLVEDGNIKEIGKGLRRYNAFDTGIFLCTPELFSALEQSQRAGDFTLSGGIRILAGRNKAKVMDIAGSFWIDVDDENARMKAESMFPGGT